MTNPVKKPSTILLAGDETVLIASVAVCLLTNGTKLIICCATNTEVLDAISRTLSTTVDYTGPDIETIEIIDNLQEAGQCEIVIILTKENIRTKLIWLNLVERYVNKNTLVLCNIESFDLSVLQQQARNPSRIIGANWSHPVQDSLFLEIIQNSETSEWHSSQLQQIASRFWNKDPYITKSGFSIRARLLCSILREAFYLIENGYANAEDIDRALRNDAGFYLSFAGNFRYMDLMGLYAYGKVMGELNPTLSKSTNSPAFFDKLVESGHLGMKTERGFFQYTKDEVYAWEHLFLQFSREMKEIISRYPIAEAHKVEVLITK